MPTGLRFWRQPNDTITTAIAPHCGLDSGSNANRVLPCGTGRTEVYCKALPLLRHQRTLPLIHRAERLVAGDRADKSVVVPRTLRFLGLLYLVEIHVVDVAAVRADRAL